MRLAAFVLCLAGCVPTVGQTPSRPAVRVQEFLHNPTVEITAISMKHEGDVIVLKGAVQIKTDTMVLVADDATYNPKTGEIEAHGKVNIKPHPLLDSPGQSQFGIK